MVNHSYSHR